MANDKRVDAYINKAPDYAKEILQHIRALVHKAIPDIEENIKWGMPAFEYKGFLAGMAAFKKHCVFGFWKAKLLNDPKGYLREIKSKGGDAMGNMGCIKELKDLPPDKVLIDFLKQAKKLNEEGIKIEKTQSRSIKKLNMPEELSKALAKNKKATAVFENFSPSHKREYAEWISEAKTESTRLKRLDTAMEWISEGKSHNWKYMKK
ncbi:MAG TPA: YdeI/OmpD-associated family protein [Bacteroidia bacterium]|nr:YdeI/OmpD-associated family protein [Bacteroidia bacterium]HNT79355.1 YdeI/OmpD-associated family protein [Bacteroidia bacterium]